MQSLLFYCRAGFEKDLANEVTQKSAALNVYGYPTLQEHSGFVLFHCHQANDAEMLGKKLVLADLVFARQMFVCSALQDELDPQDRIGDLLAACETVPQCGSLRVEYSDTSEGRELSKFCRKFTVPIRQALRKKQILTQAEMASRPILHVFFTSSTSAYVGYAFSFNCSDNPMGILRLKFPALAPSRSTLKLDEALQVFIPKQERAQRVRSGMHAVDLGACPGGWTYQLVRRGMFVQAVDNGKMDEGLMETGQVSYHPEDGFKYRPKKRNVTWLVCDMIEQPQRVAKLMAWWVAEELCKESIFNLKLPMKRRYESVQEALQIIEEVLSSYNKRYEVQVKHLYHDREEVTVHLRLS